MCPPRAEGIAPPVKMFWRRDWLVSCFNASLPNKSNFVEISLEIETPNFWAVVYMKLKFARVIGEKFKFLISFHNFYSVTNDQKKNWFVISLLVSMLMSLYCDYDKKNSYWGE